MKGNGFRLIAAIAAALPVICAVRPTEAQAGGQTGPPRTLQVLGSSADEDLGKLKSALAGANGVSAVEIIRTGRSVTIKITGSARPADLQSIAQRLGYDLLPPAPRIYAAAGPAAGAALQKLRTALASVAGVEQLQLAQRVGGATVRVRGDATGDALTSAAAAAGYKLSRESAFVASGPATTETYKRLNDQLAKVTGIAYQFRQLTGGGMLTVTSETDDGAVIAAAESAGFKLRAITGTGASGAGDDAESITPPAPGERIGDDITKVGSLAPDFTLVTQDGKSKISLSDYKGKRPTVLIFGSYT